MVRPTPAPLLALLALAAASTTALGCASTPVSQAVVQRVTPGLSNVPWISGSPFYDDQRIPDVVSNGLDACERSFEGGPKSSVLWNKWPPCPSTGTPAVAGRGLLPTSDSTASADLVRPWEEVTLFPWPCTADSSSGEITGIRCR
jgi:hypothetical protein